MMTKNEPASASERAVAAAGTDALAAPLAPASPVTTDKPASIEEAYPSQPPSPTYDPYGRVEVSRTYQAELDRLRHENLEAFRFPDPAAALEREPDADGLEDAAVSVAASPPLHPASPNLPARGGMAAGGSAAARAPIRYIDILREADAQDAEAAAASPGIRGSQLLSPRAVTPAPTSLSLFRGPVVHLHPNGEASAAGPLGRLGLVPALRHRRAVFWVVVAAATAALVSLCCAITYICTEAALVKAFDARNVAWAVVSLAVLASAACLGFARGRTPSLTDDEDQQGRDRVEEWVELNHLPPHAVAGPSRQQQQPHVPASVSGRARAATTPAVVSNQPASHISIDSADIFRGRRMAGMM